MDATETETELAAAVGDADTVVAFTGAGVSTASGVPDFRGESGVWNRFDPESFHYDRFRGDPAGFWTDRVDLHETMFGEDVAPNAAHEALDDLAAAGRLDAVVTQNTDGLHVGTPADLVELHGNADRVACETCGERFDAEPVHERVRAGEERPPRCDADGCDGLLKPDVVLFGERLPETDLSMARSWAKRADVFLAVGSSLTVEPAASLPRIASRSDATTAVVNLEPTPFDERAAFVLRRDVTDVLPALADRVVSG
ncbi:NAD-dependent protein deacetylase [halophilic archaeon]|nr:NAD-dependent protein deacetylase [halophilic archaeon]